VEGQGLSYTYTVNGRAEVVRGMGYNPSFAGLPPDERRARYQRDFSAMAAAGVNTIFGWNPLEFDGLTLDVAAENGLGVALPYDLDWQLDYADPAVQVEVGKDVLAWVARYRQHPAVRMWAIGNEALFRLVPPAWCGAPSAAERARAEAFGRFYATLIDQVHELDPAHPIIYRAAEDSFVSWMRSALAGSSRPWFVYGVNTYTPRLAAILDGWSAQGFDVALLVSEFAPGPESRPTGYAAYWSTIRSHPQSVLGGAVYVWYRDGPEDIDHQYGLVDPNGQAVDGSLDQIGQAFHAD
jgi:beta-galactosidase/beta-glucuronidase